MRWGDIVVSWTLSIFPPIHVKSNERFFCQIVYHLTPIQTSIAITEMKVSVDISIFHLKRSSNIYSATDWNNLCSVYARSIKLRIFIRGGHDNLWPCMYNT